MRGRPRRGGARPRPPSARRCRRRGGGQHVAEQRAAGEAVQHLGQGRRPHPGALAGGEDDDRERSVRSRGEHLSRRAAASGLAGGLGLEPRLHGSKGRRAADYPIPQVPPAAVGRRPVSSLFHAAAAPARVDGYADVSYASVTTSGRIHRRSAPNTPRAPPPCARRRPAAKDAPMTLVDDRPQTPTARPPAPSPSSRARKTTRRAVHALHVRDRAVPGLPRRRPGRVGLGAGLDRRRPVRRLLRRLRARHHRRLPPAVHPRLVQGQPRRCASRWPSPARWPSRARSSAGSPTTAATTRSATARATRTRRGATARRVPALVKGFWLRAHRLAVRRRAHQPREVHARPDARPATSASSTRCSRCGSLVSLLAAGRCSAA